MQVVKPADLGALQIRVEALGPVGDVLDTGEAGFDEVAIHRGHVVADLQQLDLQAAGIGERHRVVRLVAPAPEGVRFTIGTFGL